MAVIRIPAARVRQGALVLYATALKVRDLVAPDFYCVETLDPQPASQKGYQRLLNQTRTRRLAEYLIRGQDSRDAFLPTSVFLATDRSIAVDEQSNTIEFDPGVIGPFSVVDGQHRLEGLKMATRKDFRLLEFEVPVNIAVNLPRIAQMCHFLIVNGTQTSVDKSVEQRIIARLSDALDVEELPSLPKWIRDLVERGEVERAVKYADCLNDAEDSLWRGKILMANVESGAARVTQRAFVKAIVKYVLTANNPLAIVKDFEKEKRIFLNYWKAIATHCDDGESVGLYRYNGVELFCKFSIPFFTRLQDRGSFTVPAMEKLFAECFAHVEGEYAGVGQPGWWRKGGQGTLLHSHAMNLVCRELSRALHKASMSASIEL